LAQSALRDEHFGFDRGGGIDDQRAGGIQEIGDGLLVRWERDCGVGLRRLG